MHRSSSEQSSIEGPRHNTSHDKWWETVLTLVNVFPFLERYQVLECWNHCWEDRWGAGSAQAVAVGVQDTGDEWHRQQQRPRWVRWGHKSSRSAITIASGKGCGVATQFHDGLFYLWLRSHLLCTLCAHELLPWSSFSVPSFAYQNQQVNGLFCLNQFTKRSKLNCLLSTREFEITLILKIENLDELVNL